MSPDPPYLQDIRAQPASLARLIDAGLGSDLTRLLSDIARYDRIVMTGMGASLFGQYPAYLRLAEAGLPVWLIETSELLGEAHGLITPRTLLWITSQSGESAEIAALLARIPAPGPTVLGVTNAEDGQLAREADVVLPLHSGDEHAVGTKSYVATLAAHALAVDHALGAPADAGLRAAPERLAGYLDQLEAHVDELDAALPERTLFVVGRGASLAAVQTGALIVKEAAKVPIEGMSAPQFRHGPLDIIEPGVAVVALAGSAANVPRNRQLVEDVRRLGGNGYWIAGTADGDGHRLADLGSAAALPIAEIVPLQLLSVALARRRHIEPGAFRHIGKVTRTL